MNNNNLLLAGDTVIFPDGDTLLSYVDPDIIGMFGTSSYSHRTSWLWVLLFKFGLTLH
jgi:hypothetical protein